MVRKPARQASRPYDFTPARRQAFQAASQKRTFQMTPAKQEALRKATEANRRNYRLTSARRRAMRANARKMQKGSVEKFQMTEKRQRANRANLQKAWATKRTPESRLRSRFNHLKHGLHVRTLEETMHLLGEDSKEFEAHCGRFRRVFAPLNRAEEKVVRRIAAAVWRQLRLFKAQARWQSDTLRRLFQRAPLIPRLDVDETRQRAMFLLILMTDRDKFALHDQRLIAGVERALRLLLRLRADGNPDFQLYSRQTEKEWKEYERLLDEMAAESKEIAEEEQRIAWLERLREGGPEVEAALARARKNLGWPA